METITIERKITNEEVKPILEMDIDKLELSTYWDSHGTQIPDDKMTFKKCHIKLQRHSWIEFGQEWDEVQLFVNDKKIDADITSVRGGDKVLKLRGCIGWG